MADIIFNVDEDRAGNDPPDWILESADAVAAALCEKIDEFMLEDMKEAEVDGQS